MTRDIIGGQGPPTSKRRPVARAAHVAKQAISNGPAYKGSRASPQGWRSINTLAAIVIAGDSAGGAP
jgi:hypothetical protein